MFEVVELQFWNSSAYDFFSLLVVKNIWEISSKKMKEAFNILEPKEGLGYLSNIAKLNDKCFTSCLSS